LRAKSNRKRRKINAFGAKTTLLQRPLNSYQNSFKSQIYPVMLDRVILKIGVETN
jgi:hypothetical protein